MRNGQSRSFVLSRGKIGYGFLRDLRLGGSRIDFGRRRRWRRLRCGRRNRLGSGRRLSLGRSFIRRGGWAGWRGSRRRGCRRCTAFRGGRRYRRSLSRRRRGVGWRRYRRGGSAGSRGHRRRRSRLRRRIVGLRRGRRLLNSGLRCLGHRHCAQQRERRSRHPELFRSLHKATVSGEGGHKSSRHFRRYSDYCRRHLCRLGITSSSQGRPQGQQQTLLLCDNKHDYKWQLINLE